jgi:hypothetical protein
VLKPEHQERRNKMSTADLCILWKRPKIYKDIIYYATLATVLKSKNGNKKIDLHNQKCINRGVICLSLYKTCIIKE